jgi:membrane protein DedA with SNARE-associated domain
MDSLLADAGALMIAHREWAVPFLALLAFAECVAVVGVLFPATATMITIGGLMGAGLIDPVAGTLAAMAGAAAGGWASFHLGRRLGPGTLSRWPFARHRRKLAITRLFFRRHGVLSIVLARFYGPARAIVPLAAGLMAMRRTTFELANAASAVLWVVVLFLAGWVTQQSMAAVSLAPAAKIPIFLALAIATSAGSTTTLRRLFADPRDNRLRAH